MYVKRDDYVMNIFSYIDKYGEFTFDEVSFNEVDNAIMASLSYINFNNIVINVQNVYDNPVHNVMLSR